MSLSSGTRIGPYEIVAPIGAGGMGEVYRARDARLDRDVAIKILPPAFAADADRLARFEREAKTLASLNHSNIAQIYGLEVAQGLSPATTALVMELVDGEDLAQRIARGAMPIDEALAVARQIADALEAAHERGIIHRDLKPANVKLREDGHVKVLDFGLAKALDPAGHGFSSDSALMNSPTITSPATQLGMIIGTAAYMAPEQAKGRPIDRRADVWAFGVVLFEMLTGKRVFEGGDVTEVLASVIKDTPSHDALPAATPPAIRRLLRRCLEKNPAKRLDSMAAARLEIDDALEGDAARATPAAAAVPRWRTAAPWAVAVAALAIAATAGVMSWRRTAESADITRLKIDPGFKGTINTPFGSALALSPDGRTLVIAALDENGMGRLYVRRLDRLEAVPLEGTEGAADPFFSPNGEWIGFFASGRLRKIAVSGGAAIDIAATQVARGGAWAEDGTIYFTPNAVAGARLMRLPPAGGEPQPVGEMFAGHVTQRWPQVLPGGKAVIYTGHTTVDTFEEASLMVQTLDGSAPRELMKGGYSWRYIPTGHIVYVHAGTLFAVPFDLDRLEITGTSLPVVEEVVASPISGGAQVAFAGNGAMAYMRGRVQTLGSTLSWIGVDGKITTVREMKDNWTALAVSPEGTRIVMDRQTGVEHPEIWVVDLARDTETRLTVNRVAELVPIWTRDGKRIVYSAATEGPPNLFWQPADGSAPAERLGKTDEMQFPWAWSPDGKRLVFSQGGGTLDLFVMTFPERTVTPFTRTPASEGHASISRDGKWIAYSSDESGHYEIYVQPFPSGSGRWMVSNGAGLWPIWSPVSDVLYFSTLSARLMSVTYEAKDGVFQAGRPAPVPNGQMLARGAFYSWSIHPDGRRFLATVPDMKTAGAPQELVLVRGFFDDLKARVR